LPLLLIRFFDAFVYLFAGPVTVLATIPWSLLRLEEYWGWSRLPIATEVHALGVVLLNGGAVLALWCTFQFIRQGHGTPIPTTPPSELVATGIYRFTRNPMMLALLLTGVGEVVVTGSGLLLLWIFVGARAGHLYIVELEEPVLRQRFGAAFDDYCRKVPRWW